MFQTLEMAEIFRQNVLGAGFSITYNPDRFGEQQRVEIEWSDDRKQTAYGSSLATAINRYRLSQRDTWVELPEEFRSQWLKVLQQECPHANSSPSRENPLMVFCDDCYKQLR
jgi:hypothetical protein